ncbi:uncharacterized protein [Engystomops pustulosus]|uniref:uncharacterized protein n=1 Tax=Engystomops pustulosus TaxID=76066 RepID=UPI003AFA237B
MSLEAPGGDLINLTGTREAIVTRIYRGDIYGQKHQIEDPYLPKRPKENKHHGRDLCCVLPLRIEVRGDDHTGTKNTCPGTHERYKIGCQTSSHGPRTNYEIETHTQTFSRMP